MRRESLSIGSICIAGAFVAAAMLMPLSAHGADRMVFCEEFTANT